VDKCTNSIIVLGPCSSSAFLRDCSDCLFIVTCQQLRVRDCYNCQIMLFSHTEPVIESSSGLSFLCHQFSYPGFLDQMNQADLPIWNNKWT